LAEAFFSAAMRAFYSMFDSPYGRASDDVLVVSLAQVF
jgi:hypothetical protein